MIDSILSSLSHRPYELPKGGWRYYQEWNDAVFLHWQVPMDVLRPLVPEPLSIDSFDGHSYVSLVAFTMEEIRPRYLPAVGFISDFHEINIRTYVSHNGKSGVFFLDIQAEKPLSSFIAKVISGLPYQTAKMKRAAGRYQCLNIRTKFDFDVCFSLKEHITLSSAIDKWLTERYCLYLIDNGEVFRYDVHHKEWGLRKMEITELQLDYQQDKLMLGGTPPLLTHYSEGVQVLAWRRERI